MISSLLKIFKIKQLEGITIVLGEQLQFLFSKLVMCCVPSESSSKLAIVTVQPMLEQVSQFQTELLEKRFLQNQYQIAAHILLPQDELYVSVGSHPPQTLSRNPLQANCIFAFW